MSNYTVTLEVKNEKAKAKVEEFVKSLDKVDEESKQINNNFDELGGTLDNVTGGAITKFKGLTGSLKNVTKGMRTLRGAIISTGIGALVVAVGSLTQAFTASEEGQNRLSKILKQLGVVAGNVGDIFYSLGDVIYNVFTGNFDEAAKAFENLQDRVLNFTTDTQKELKLAGELADLIADANKKERELLVERAKTNVEINKLKTKAAEVDKFTSEQRIAFLEQAAALEDEITGKEVALARTRLTIKQQENTLSESTKEDLQEEAQLQADLISLEEQRLIRNKELLGVAAGLRKAEADARKAEREAEIEGFRKQQEERDKILKESIVKNEGLELESNANIAQGLKNLQTERQRIADESVVTEEKVAEAKKSAADQAINLFGAETTAGKIALVAKQALAAKEMIMEAKKTITFASLATAKSSAAVAEGSAQTSKVGFPQNVPLLIAYGLQAAGIISAVASAVGKAKSAAASAGGSFGGGVSAGGASAAPQAPSFNVVGASPTSQLAESISEREDKPIKAFVVSNEVSNQQALDRNITGAASFG